MRLWRAFSLIACLLACFVCLTARADEFYCEVLDVQGMVTLSNDTQHAKVVEEGDILKVDDVLEVGADAYADLAYDREWNNITRIEGNSKICIRALYPTTLQLESGGVFARLRQLPKESSFEIQTPTAIASVRGTEYRTTFTGGQTEVFNVSDSEVLVYGVDESGQRQVVEPVVLRNSQKTQVMDRGGRPMAPLRMETADFVPMNRMRQKIENKIQSNLVHGRHGKIQDLRQIEQARAGQSGSTLVSGMTSWTPKPRPKAPEAEQIEKDLSELPNDQLPEDPKKLELLRRRLEDALSNAPPEQRARIKRMQAEIDQVRRRVGGRTPSFQKQQGPSDDPPPRPVRAAARPRPKPQQ